MLYNFKTIEEFVKYMDDRAKDMRTKQQAVHTRSHDHARMGAGAAEIENIACMVRNSNIGIVCDLDD